MGECARDVLRPSVTLFDRRPPSLSAASSSRTAHSTTLLSGFVRYLSLYVCERVKKINKYLRLFGMEHIHSSIEAQLPFIMGRLVGQNHNGHPEQGGDLCRSYHACCANTSIGLQIYILRGFRTGQF